MRAVSACLVLLPSWAFAAPSYFLYCDVAFESVDFAPLRDHLSSDPIQQADKCMRLTNSEFLVTGNSKGPYNGTASNLFYCNLKGDKAGCVEDEGSFYYPDLRLVRQFSGVHGKQYVLWSTSLFRRGVTSSGYFIFNLVPKSVAPRGYVFYSLGVGTVTTGSDGGGDPCEGLNPSDEHAVEVGDVKVLGEGTEAVAIDFAESLTSCRTKAQTSRTVRFVLKDGKFQSE